MKIIRMLKAWPRSLLFRTPFTANIKITTRCNLRCGFCGLWSLPVSRELHLDNYRVIADLLNKTGLARAVITGGEPLLRDDAPEIVALFARRGISTTLLTNGTLLSTQKLDRLIRLGLNDIGISLDSLDPSTLDRICQGRNIWTRVVDAIRMCSDRLRNGIVEVLTTVTRENLRDIPDIVRFVHHDLGAWSVINPVNAPADHSSILSASKPEWAPPFPASEVDAVYDRLQAMKKQGIRILVSDAFLADSREYLKTGRFKWRCDAGERYFTIFPDGGLAPCSDTASVRRITGMKPADFFDPSYTREVREVQKQCEGCIFSCWREATYVFSRKRVWVERALTLGSIVRRDRKP